MTTAVAHAGGPCRDYPTVGGILPMRPAWKSSTASMISDFVFITNGPYENTGSRIGRPPSSSTSSGSPASGSASTTSTSPAPNAAT